MIFLLKYINNNGLNGSAMGVLQLAVCTCDHKLYVMQD